MAIIIAIGFSMFILVDPSAKVNWNSCVCDNSTGHIFSRGKCFFWETQVILERPAGAAG